MQPKAILIPDDALRAARHTHAYMTHTQPVALQVLADGSLQVNVPEKRQI
jgi:hypothetical protein